MVRACPGGVSQTRALGGHESVVRRIHAQRRAVSCLWHRRRGACDRRVIPIMLGWLVLAPVSLASVYTSYCDIYEDAGTAPLGVPG